MATTVGQHSVAAFTSPSNGDALDATVVKGNDNTLRSAYVDHDADSGIHIQSSDLASRPAAGTAGRKWITTDVGDVRFWYDNGSTWEEVATATTLPQLTVTGNTTLGDATSDTITMNGRVASSIVPSSNNTRDLGSAANQFKDIYSAGVIYPTTISGGTISGSTISGGTLSGTITNSGTINGGTVAPTTLTIPSGTAVNLAYSNSPNTSQVTVTSTSPASPTTIQAFSFSKGTWIVTINGYFSFGTAGYVTVFFDNNTYQIVAGNPTTTNEAIPFSITQLLTFGVGGGTSTFSGFRSSSGVDVNVFWRNFFALRVTA